MQYILAHDIGTSGNKAVLYDENGALVSFRVESYASRYPGPNCVEQDARDWYGAVCSATKELLARTGVSPKDVAGVSFSGQMMGCLPVGADDEPLMNSIIWADTRASAEADKMTAALGADGGAAGYRLAGHRLSASYSAAKLMWVRDHAPQVYKKTRKTLNAKDFIILKLTGRAVTDYSDAGGTNLFDISKKAWSPELIAAAGVDADMLPELLRSTDIAGRVTARAAAECGLLEGTPVVTGGGDGSCATLGAGVWQKGGMYNVLGSSSWVSYADDKPYFDEKMRTFNWVTLDENLIAPCGTMQTAAYAFDWVTDLLAAGFGDKASDKDAFYSRLERAINAVPAGANGAVFLPYLLGERSPRWDVNAKAAFLGLSMTNTREDMLRAAIEGVALNLKIILDCFSNPADVILIGGGARSSAWRQILADVWQRRLLIPRYVEEASSIGAAVCCGVGLGIFEGFSAAARINPIEEAVEPNAGNKAVYDRAFRVFDSAYYALKDVII